jgi:hypothetical protein
METTQLLKLNLTDFLDEIKQDLKNLKYNLKLADLQVISNIDIQNFLQRISNNFENDNLMIVYDDISRWEFHVVGKDSVEPYIIKQIKQAIELKIYDNMYSKTSEALKANKNYIDKDFEGNELQRLYLCEKLPMYLAKSYQGYSDAIDDYKADKNNLQDENLIKLDIENKNQPQPPEHFTRSFTINEQSKLFNGLVNLGFLHKTTNKNHLKSASPQFVLKERFCNTKIVIMPSFLIIFLEDFFCFFIRNFSPARLQ